MPNHKSENNNTLGKAKYTIVSTICHLVIIFFDYQNTGIQLG